MYISDEFALHTKIDPYILKIIQLVHKLICLPSPVAASTSVQPAELQHRLRRVSLLQQGMGCFFVLVFFFLQVGFVHHKEQLVSVW